MVNTYDSKNRITSTGYGTAEQTYTYDQYGQLTQTVDTANGFTETYSYDQRGNILSKTKVYDDSSFPAETTNFSYGNAAWPDELTSVNGTSLTYDANGNVLTYGNMEFEWTNGRTLSQITVNPEDENGTADVYSYTYDESGIRSSKTVNGTTTYFTTKDGVILSQTDGTNTMYFQYDNSGNPTGFLYNGTQYFYLTNQMGDVIGITDNTGALIATYTYGAWGEVLATTPATAGSSAQLAIANANPLRYRGYYLDAETGYYYLQSRYYDSGFCRFISSDELLLETIWSLNGFAENVFAYCYNNAVNNIDPDGHFTVAFVYGTAIAAASVSALLLASVLNTYYSNQSIRNTIDYAVAKYVDGVIDGTKQFAIALTKIVKKTKVSRKYKGTERHHIVAKRASRARPAQNVLRALGISFDCKYNLVDINKSLHKHVHTNLYYDSVNTIIVTATSKGNKKSKTWTVYACLMTIGYVLRKAGTLCK